MRYPNMKKKFLSLSSMALLSVLSLGACGGAKLGTPVTVIDDREELYVAALGETADGVFEVYERTNFKSLYEAAHYVMENGDKGSYVYTLGDTTERKLFSITGLQSDYWFYYKDGNMLDGYSIYVAGDVEYYRGEKYTRILSASGYSAATYQPYVLMGHEENGTQAWNRTYYMDTVVRYNPKAFTGIQDSTYLFELSQAKIRPSLSSASKVIPTVTLSTTDSYNWSNQGIYMDSTTGNWYYVEGEVQSAVKALEYDEDNIIMQSKWDSSKQEFTPEADVRMTLNMVYDEENEFTSNDLTIEVIKDGKVTKTIKKNYEYSGMTMRGTHRANIALDIVPADEELDEETTTPDFMCGAYFDNVIVSEGKGTVREGLTDEIYQGDSPMCCEAGETYDLLYAKGGYNNLSGTDVLLDNYACIDYSDRNAEKDTWRISYAQSKSEMVRSQEVEDVIELIKLIPDNATVFTDEFMTAYSLYQTLTEPQKLLISEIDGYNKIRQILGE